MVILSNITALRYNACEAFPLGCYLAFIWLIDEDINVIELWRAEHPPSDELFAEECTPDAHYAFMIVGGGSIEA
jgi:hypothetical protein